MIKLVIELKTHFVFKTESILVKNAANQLCEKFDFVPTKLSNSKRKVINNSEEWAPIQKCMKEAIEKGHIRARKIKGEIRYEYFDGSNYSSLLNVVRFFGC